MLFRSAGSSIRVILIQKVMSSGHVVKADEATVPHCTGWTAVQLGKETHGQLIVLRVTNYSIQS